MAIRGVTFSQQIVSSNDDSHVFKVMLGGRKGRSRGCNMTYGTDDIFVSSGYFFAANRLVEISSSETISTPVVTSGTTYCRLVFEIDLAKTNTNNEFNQGYFIVLTSDTSYPAITQEDHESGGNIYQLPFARFTKTASGIGSFVSELESIGSMPNETDSTIYVSAAGNDASGDGSESYPFRTIQHAVDFLPKNIANKEITINVASGTYAESVTISGFSGGTLRFAFGSVTINELQVFESCVILSGTALTIAASGKTYGVYLHRGANVICQIPLTINGAVNGIYAAYGSTFESRNAITINSCTYAATAIYSSYVYISALAGSRNNNGIQAAAGIVSFGSIDSAMASTLYVTSAGGRIFSGAQTSAPAY